MSIDDKIKQANEANKKIIEEQNTPNPPNTKAHKSSITTPEQDRQLVNQLAEAMGYRQQQEDIDALKQGMLQINENINNVGISMQKMVEMIDKHSQIINNLQGNPNPQNAAAMPQGQNNLDQLANIGQVVEQLAAAWKTIKGQDGPPQMQPLISQETINEKMTKAFMDDLDTGESIRKFISDSLKKKATREIVNKSLGDIGSNVHTPE